jgi:RNA polymerase sigma-70 factor (ECF subfamily)
MFMTDAPPLVDLALPLSLSANRAQRLAAFDQMVLEQAEGIARYLYAMTGDRQTAEDLTQEVFLRAWEKLDFLRDPASARSWLFAIAANTARRHLRRAGLFGWLPLDVLRTEAPRLLPPEVDASAVDLESALSTLSADDRAVLMLVCLEDLSLAEAGASLGISAEAAKKRWQRACARFRAALMQAGHEVPR